MINSKETPKKKAQIKTTIQRVGLFFVFEHFFYCVVNMQQQKQYEDNVIEMDTESAQRLHTYTVRYFLQDTSRCVEQMRGAANMQRIMRQFPCVRNVLWSLAGSQRFRQVDRQQPSIEEEFEQCRLAERKLQDYLAKRTWVSSAVSSSATTTIPPSVLFHQMTQMLYHQVYLSCRVNDFVSPSLRKLAPLFRLCQSSTPSSAKN